MSSQICTPKPTQWRLRYRSGYGWTVYYLDPEDGSSRATVYFDRQDEAIRYLALLLHTTPLHIYQGRFRI